MDDTGEYPSKPYLHSRTEKFELVWAISSSGLSGTVIGSTRASLEIVFRPSMLVASHEKLVGFLIPKTKTCE